MSASFSLRQILRKCGSRRTAISGFTLLELLISMIVAGVVVSGLLYLVVELLQIDRREARLTQTQRDMQRAIDYISEEVQEAVYIYPDPSVIQAELSDLTAADGTPVLAFWRPIPINGFPDCAPWAPGGASADIALYDRCQVLAIRQASYSLVVYLQKNRTAADTVWEGASRIVRYELDEYKSPLANLEITDGYQDPTRPGVGFREWESDGATSGTKAVLVDFVDSPTATVLQSPQQTCDDLIGNYTVVPSTATTVTSNTSFFGCVRGSAVAGDEDSNINQDAFLFLRGNAVDGARGVINSFSDSSSLPTLQTRVMMRGVVDKNPN